MYISSVHTKDINVVLLASFVPWARPAAFYWQEFRRGNVRDCLRPCKCSRPIND